VWPFIRFIRAVLPQMIKRQEGKIVAITSGATFRPIEGFSIYTAARGAQNSFIKVVGAEVARHNVQVNAVGPAFVENNIYFTPELLADPKIRGQLESIIPAGRLDPATKAASLALCLATEASDFMAGQVIPVSGGWAQ
jgi:2-keto-3-deoxy-L-fuconate dehydrogenase